MEKKIEELTPQQLSNKRRNKRRRTVREVKRLNKTAHIEAQKKHKEHT